MLVAFPEEKQEEVNEGTAQFHEQLMDVVNDPSEQIVKANGIQSVLHNLENVTTLCHTRRCKQEIVKNGQEKKRNY